MDDTRATSETSLQALAMLNDLFGRLNADPSRLCEAIRGHPLRLMLQLFDPDITMRIVIMADGVVVRASDTGLLGEDFEPQVTLQGDVQEVTSVLRGEKTLQQAVREGSLTVADRDVPTVEAVRNVISEACINLGDALGGDHPSGSVPGS